MWIFQRTFIAALFLWVALSSSCGSESAEPAGSRAAAPPAARIAQVLSDAAPKHVLLVVIDTLRADHLGCYGYGRDTSPNMDALAASGVRFERAIAQSSWTSPSMITMMIGHRLSARRLAIPDGNPTLAEMFQDAGYATGAFVANPLLNEENGFHRGFDRWLMDEKKGLNDLRPVQEWLRSQQHSDTFTWVHFTDPHDPYIPPKSAMTAEIGRLHGNAEALMRRAVADEGYGGYEQQRKHMMSQIGRYDDEIVAVDRKLGELLKTQRRMGNLDNTLVIITSDHGECLWQRNEAKIQVAHQTKGREERGIKTRLKHRLKQTHGTFVYQELVRVPLILSGPGLAPRVFQGVAESVSLPSTILALAGVDVGQFPAMSGENYFAPGTATGGYAMTDQGEAFLAEDGWKLILPTEAGRTAFQIELQLYDLNNDPGELQNLAEDHPERVKQLTGQIKERRAQALPLESGDSWQEAARKNAAVLAGLGYTDGGFLDPLEDPPEAE